MFLPGLDNNDNLRMMFNQKKAIDTINDDNFHSISLHAQEMPKSDSTGTNLAQHILATFEKGDKPIMEI